MQIPCCVQRLLKSFSVTNRIRNSRARRGRRGEGVEGGFGGLSRGATVPRSLLRVVGGGPGGVEVGLGLEFSRARRSHRLNQRLARTHRVYGITRSVTPQSGRKSGPMKSAALLVLALLVSGCGSSSTAPTPTPTPVPPPPTPASYVINGVVTATNGSQPLSGLSVDLNGQPTTTNGAGGFTYMLTSGATSRLTLAGAGIVPRALTVNTATARTLTVGAIALGGGFDLAFYRQLVRNTFDAPGTMEPLRRWTVNPSVYLRTVDDAGGLVEGKNLDIAEAAIRETAAIWTAGTLAIATVERGTGTRAGIAGWITVQWLAAATSSRCGQAHVGLSGGTIDLFYKATGSCQCDGAIRPRSVRHELGHAFGYWHTDNPADLMFASATVCDALPSTRERYHAAIAYARPIGNTDPDQDPSSVVNLAPLRVR